VIALAKLARAYRALGRPADAEPLLKRSVRFLRRYARRDHVVQLARRLQELAEIYLDGGRLDAAEPLLSEAVKEWGAAVADHPEWHDLDPERAGALAAYAALLERTGRGGEALALRRRAAPLRGTAPPRPAWRPSCPPVETVAPHACAFAAALTGRSAEAPNAGALLFLGPMLSCPNPRGRGGPGAGVPLAAIRGLRGRESESRRRSQPARWSRAPRSAC